MNTSVSLSARARAWACHMRECALRPLAHGLQKPLASAMLCCVLPAAPPPHTGANRPPASPETVVLLHGLIRGSRSMRSMAGSLRAEGYTVINCDYPSRSADVDTLAAELFARLTPQLESARRVHFVTHSLGGVLLRVYLQDHTIANLGRVVMLAPPNGGSEITDKLGSLKLYRWLNGPAGNQLGTGAGSAASRLKPPAFELGVIAGDRSVNPILSLLIPGPDDGKVSVARAQAEGMRDFIRLHVTHTFMMRNRQVIQQTLNFLKNGTFQRAQTNQAG